ncbi:hypothetical protein CRE_28626 [Caenorhabditis remanei]|uniref:NR LBD domain-containing protein n=1 Tax=Caenorhabditis remanei TaxID=31234 RepID=E3LNB6_CAERE|nr:hypothetical protein CRE_28626 [Caenorhabditis remanei]
MKRNSDTMSKEESINEQLKLEFPSKSRKRYSEEVKIEIDNDILRSPLHCTPNNQEQAEFNEMVHAYKLHQRMMQLSFSNIDEFLDEHEEGPKLRKMDPSDVKQLSEVEFAGLIYWIDKQKPYGELPSEDKSALLTRYSVRKLSLDHFYSASKYPDHCSRREFVMNNYTYVPSDRTGFEQQDDDEQQIAAKVALFSGTFTRFWNNVIDQFVAMKIHDAEIVFLHSMLLWSASNNEHVTKETIKVMESRRNWAITRLSTWYKNRNMKEADLRLQRVLSLHTEIEIICDMHCQDFLVAKMFDICDMSEFFYEKLCYAPCNADPKKIDPELYEKFKQYTKKERQEATEAINESEIQENSQSDSPGKENRCPLENENKVEIAEKKESSFIDIIDPVHLVLNSQILPKVMANLPDDNYNMLFSHYFS